MKNSKLLFSLFLMGTLLLIVSLVSANDDMAHAPAQGKKATVTFSTPYKFGGFTLKPGTYQFQHRVSNGDHYLYFTSLSGRSLTGGVRCQIEPQNEKVAATALTTVADGGFRRITRIAIGGEQVAHVLEPADDSLASGVDLR